MGYVRMIAFWLVFVAVFQRVYGVEKCAAFSDSCGVCTKSEWLLGHCGFCWDGGKGECKDGFESGPYSGECKQWEWYGAGGAPNQQCCPAYGNCSLCPSAQCAWCQESTSCVHTQTTSGFNCKHDVFVVGCWLCWGLLVNVSPSFFFSSSFFVLFPKVPRWPIVVRFTKIALHVVRIHLVNGVLMELLILVLQRRLRAICLMLLAVLHLVVLDAKLAKQIHHVSIAFLHLNVRQRLEGSVPFQRTQHVAMQCRK